ncbi:MAG: noncanonical pyrimidine nucleotidase, YjjG family [Bacteroidia bacterium]|nr:noncanonical pyrimidine nucleotidase, YjjG family [Bacteroidia bacterium]
MYKHIFFDLDHTLWDHDKNSHEALSAITDNHGVNNICNTDFKTFHHKYVDINYSLWTDYHQKKIEKELLRWKRFDMTLNAFKVDNEKLAKQMADDYLDMCPKGPHLIDDAHEVLEYLQPKYKLHVVTNGFKEAQYTKIKHSDLHQYFTEIFISEEVGYLKPNPKIFEVAMDKIETTVDECLMIGDNLDTDIAGAQNAGMDFYFFNPENKESEIKESAQITELKQLLELL